MMTRITILPTGSTPLDLILEGGLRAKEVTAIFGEAGTGKTTVAYQSMINAAKEGIGTVFIDTENKFDPRRINQIKKMDLSEHLIILQPETFDQQIQYLQSLGDIICGRPFRVLIIDTVSNLYRLKMSLREIDIGVLRRLLEQHHARIHGETKNRDLFTLITGQVRDKDGEKRPVGEDHLYAYSKRVIELKNEEKVNESGIVTKYRLIVLKKGTDDTIERSLPYKITEQGIRPI